MCAPGMSSGDGVVGTAATTHLYVATPCYACRMNAAYVACLLQLQGECMTRGISIQIQHLGNESLIQRGRNIMIEKFFQSGAEVLLFLDADLAFSTEAILDRLLPFARAHPEAVVTGVYPKKDWDFSRLDVANTVEPLHMQACDFNINVTGEAVVDKGFVRVLDSATGCMMIPRAVVARMRAAHPELHCVNDINPGRHPVKDYVAIMDCMIEPGTERYLSEDYAFCRRWQALGGEIWVDLATGMCHIGTRMYSGDIRERCTMSFAS